MNPAVEAAEKHVIPAVEGLYPSATEIIHGELHDGPLADFMERYGIDILIGFPAGWRAVSLRIRPNNGDTDVSFRERHDRSPADWVPEREKLERAGDPEWPDVDVQHDLIIHAIGDGETMADVVANGLERLYVIDSATVAEGLAADTFPGIQRNDKDDGSAATYIPIADLVLADAVQTVTRFHTTEPIKVRIDVGGAGSDDSEAGQTSLASFGSTATAGGGR